MERVLVVEDERKINDIVRDYLSSLGYSVTQCFTGLDAVELNGRERFSLIILDLMLPGIDGIEVARRVRETSGVPVIMLTARDSEADKLLGLEIGADDYITKPFSVRELGARVRAVLRRYAVSAETRKGDETITHGDVELDIARHRVLRKGREIALTSAQFELLRILFSDPGRVFSRRDLIEKMSGYDYEGYERTIDVHVKNIRKVLEDDPADPRILLTVWGIGYKTGAVS
jgi:two-component system, OmpR family, response regulator RegX3